MTREEAKSCIGTIELLQRLAYNIHGVMDVIDAANCEKIIKALEQEPCEDAISRQEVLDLIADYDLSMGQVVRGIHALPPVTPQEPRLDTIKQILEDSDLDAERTLEIIKEVVEE